MSIGNLCVSGPETLIDSDNYHKKTRLLVTGGTNGISLTAKKPYNGTSCKKDDIYIVLDPESVDYLIHTLQFMKKHFKE